MRQPVAASAVHRTAGFSAPVCVRSQLSSCSLRSQVCRTVCPAGRGWRFVSTASARNGRSLRNPVKLYSVRCSRFSCSLVFDLLSRTNHALEGFLYIWYYVRCLLNSGRCACLFSAGQASVVPAEHHSAVRGWCVPGVGFTFPGRVCSCGDSGEWSHLPLVVCLPRAVPCIGACVAWYSQR